MSLKYHGSGGLGQILEGLEAEIFDVLGFGEDFGMLGAEIFDFVVVLEGFWKA